MPDKKKQTDPNSFDFEMVRKPKAKPVIKHRPKREVFSHEMRLLPKLGPAKTIKSSLPKTRPVFQVMPRFFKVSLKTAVPAFAAILLILAFGFHALNFLFTANSDKGQILGAATSAYSDLKLAQQTLSSRDFQSASGLFASATDNLNKATEKLNSYGPLSYFVPQAKQAKLILQGAGSLASAGTKLSSALSAFSSVKIGQTGVADGNFNAMLSASKGELEASLVLLKDAQSKFAQVKNPPTGYADQFNQARGQVDTLVSVIENLVSFEDLYLDFFGSDKTYLLAFQNYDELRATGGFMGTIGTLRLINGKISRLNIESVYNFDGSYYKRIAAPGPFQPDIKLWGLRDSNWFADFPTSAQKMVSIYEQGRETTDGVIAVTPKVFSDLLTLTGPIYLPGYETTLTADNFQEMVQQKTSVDYDKTLNQPKKFLADFAPLLIDKLMQLKQEDTIKLLQIINNDLSEKNILVYSTSGVIQTKVSALGFSGEVLSAPVDYLYVVNTNLGGTKTDLEMKQRISLNSFINLNGKVTNTLTIERQNTSAEVNKNFLRVLVPLGSKLLQTQGLDNVPQFSSVAENAATDPELAAWDKGKSVNAAYVRTESGKTEFSGWIETKGGESKTVTFAYELPYSLDFSSVSGTAPMSLLLQRQPGSEQTEFTGKWSYPGLTVPWNSGKLEQGTNSASFASNLNQDGFWSVLLKK
ncbi:MAG: DUF4012 domain-containing protein [Acidobacteriaceae bacterium]